MVYPNRALIALSFIASVALHATALCITFHGERENWGYFGTTRSLDQTDRLVGLLRPQKKGGFNGYPVVSEARSRLPGQLANNSQEENRSDQFPDELAAYIDPSTLDQPAIVSTPPDLPIPSSPNLTNGSMTLKLFINEDGSVDYVEILESNIPVDYAQAIAGRFKEAVFAPGFLEGSAVKTWKTFEVNYLTYP